MKREPEEVKEKPKKRRKKKKRFGYYLYAVVILVLTVLNITLAMYLLTYVQRIKVNGIGYSSQKKITDWVKEDPLTVNSIYTVCKFKRGKYQLPTYLESVKVSMSAPWEIQVDVKEKPIAGCILSDTGYIYFAEDKTVLVKSIEKRPGIPVVEGPKVKESTLYQKLKTSDEKIPNYVIKLSEQLKENDLNPEKITWEKDGMALQFGTIDVKLGKLNFDEKMIQLPPILEQLEGKKGTLHLEHYSEMSTTISFKEEKQ